MADVLDYRPGDEDVKAMNEKFMSLIADSNNPNMTKAAADAVTDYTRLKLRERGFYRKVLPSVPISNDKLDRQSWTDKPIKIVDKEPDNPAAITIPFGTLPVGAYIRGGKYVVAFCRLASPRWSKDVDELRTYEFDIRQVISDNSVKDLMAEEDSKFIAAVNLALVGPDVPTVWSGVAQWRTIRGGINRDSLMAGYQIMPQTGASLGTHTVVANQVTAYEVRKWGRDEVGGDFSEELLRKGWSDASIDEKNWVITIKRDLVPDNTLFMFADPKFIGKAFELEAPTMYVKREAFMLEFFLYETIGGSIGHTAGLVRVDYQ